MNIPEDLLYTKEHEWVKIKDDQAIIGITEFAQSQLGDIVFLELPSVGELINEGESFGEIEAVKTVSELYAPITGVISFVNEDLEDNPEKINHDCYEDGWIIKVTLNENFSKNNLLSSEQYQALIK